MLCSAAYAELGDGDGALHRLQSALSIAELVYACVRSMARARALTGAIVQVRRKWLSETFGVCSVQDQ